MGDEPINIIFLYLAIGIIECYTAFCNLLGHAYLEV